MTTRRGLGVLATCGLVLGLMAINASGALALVPEGIWMVNGANVTTELKVEATVEIEALGEPAVKHVVLLTTSGANAVEILCTEVTNVKGTIKEKEITGTLNVNKCVTFINKKEEKNCNPTNQPIPAGGTALIQLHPSGSGKYAVLQGPGGTFATLKFNEEICLALSPSIGITGELWIEDCNGKFEEELVTHLIKEAMVPALALGGLFFGANAASLDGSANLKLIGAHATMPFSGLVK